MIFTIAKKEFFENVLSRKFLIAFVLAVSILGTGVYAMGSSYQEAQSRYEITLANYEQEEVSTYTDIAEGEIFRVLGEPDPLSTLISGQMSTPSGLGGSVGGGLMGYMGGGVDVSSIVEGAVGAVETSPLWDRFGMLDLTFIVGFLMSLMAIIFSYDSISGERERGTLKLTLANNVPKDHVLLGKFIGGTASVILPYLLAMLVAAGVAALVGVTILSAGALVLVLVGCATISAFYLLGMFISALTARSTVSLLILLFIWIFLVQGIGNVAALASTATGGMSYDEFHDQYMSSSSEITGQFFSQNMGLMMQYRDAIQENDTELVEQIQEQMTAVSEEMGAELQELQTSLEEEYMRQEEARLNAALGVVIISPAECYRNVGRSLAGLDWEEGVYLQEMMSDYVDALSAEYDEWQEEQGGGGVHFPGGGGYSGSTDVFESEIMVDWYYEPLGLSERVGNATYNILAIVVFNILMFMGAYVAFLRYDVRPK